MKRMVLIEWKDAYSLSGWREEKAAVAELREDHLYFTCGFVIEENERGIIVVQSFNTDGMVADAFFIPHQYIKEVRELRRK